MFPSPRTDGPYLGLRNAFRQIASRKPQLAGVTPHTLRHSFASTAAELGLTELTVGALIGHRMGTVTSRYVHQLDAVLLAGADRVASQIEMWMREPLANDIINLAGHASAAGGPHDYTQRDSQKAAVIALRS